MIKVFLAEDEFVVREGIRKNIDWTSHGYEFCGDASDGELALPLIRKLKPDIVITDIKMPFMDGIELSRIIRKEMPDVEIIILSGYEEFEYAKEGIKLGVAQYLTKPITGAELLKEVDIISEKIKQRQQEDELRKRFEEEMEEKGLNEKKELFQKLVSGSYNTSDMLDMAGKLDINLSAMWYRVVLLWMKSDNHEIDEYSKSSISVEAQLDKIVARENVLIFDRNLDGKALIFTADTEEEAEENVRRVLTRIEELLGTYPNIRYFGGIGKAVNRLSGIHDSYEGAGYAMAHRYFTSDSLIVNYDENRIGVDSSETDFAIEDIDAKSIDRKNITKFLKLGGSDDIQFFLNDFILNAGENALKSNMFRQYIAMDAYFCVKSFAEEIVPEKDLTDLPKVEPQDLANESAVKEYMTRLFETAIQLRESIAVSRYSEIVESAIRYIEENYGDEDLSLNMIASHVNVSPNHFSTIFSQQTGSTFIKYLTEYRIEKAKELLRCTSKRSSEISEEVGYKDPHYFSYMFKKSVGMTPTKYRGGKDSEEE